MNTLIKYALITVAIFSSFSSFGLNNLNRKSLSDSASKQEMNEYSKLIKKIITKDSKTEKTVYSYGAKYDRAFHILEKMSDRQREYIVPLPPQPQFAGKPQNLKYFRRDWPYRR